MKQPFAGFDLVFNASVPAVLSSGQCIERCTAKDNAEVTDQ